MAFLVICVQKIRICYHMPTKLEHVSRNLMESKDSRVHTRPLQGNRVFQIKKNFHWCFFVLYPFRDSLHETDTRKKHPFILKKLLNLIFLSTCWEIKK